MPDFLICDRPRQLDTKGKVGAGLGHIIAEKNHQYTYHGNANQSDIGQLFQHKHHRNALHHNGDGWDNQPNQPFDLLGIAFGGITHILRAAANQVKQYHQQRHDENHEIFGSVVVGLVVNVEMNWHLRGQAIVADQPRHHAQQAEQSCEKVSFGEYFL